jgi:hypothetical protein
MEGHGSCPGPLRSDAASHSPVYEPSRYSVHLRKHETLLSRLFKQRALAVLATQASRAPCTTLVGFAASRGLRRIFFATSGSARLTTTSRCGILPGPSGRLTGPLLPLQLKDRGGQFIHPSGRLYPARCRSGDWFSVCLWRCRDAHKCGCDHGDGCSSRSICTPRVFESGL